ncbi:MAG: NAD(+)/NADH kinase [Candidatus Odinarchaeia archaeon]
MIKSVLLKVRPDLINSKFTKDLTEFIKSKGIELFLDPEGIKKEYLVQYKLMSIKNVNTDIVIIVGGDGTILYSILQLPVNSPPILGVDMGTTGFLAEITPDKINWAIERIIKGEYKIAKRLRLKVILKNKKLPDALNEVLITTEPGKTVRMDVFIDDQYVNRTVGDGIIIATPVGSTAYSLSAGGSIIDKGLDAFIIVPICAFKASLFPIIVPGNKKVKVKLITDGKPHVVVIDGQVQYQLENEDTITVVKSDNPAPFIIFEDNFYERVRGKLLTN